MWHWDGGPDGWGWLWMGVMMLIVWLPLLVVLIWGLRLLGTSSRERDRGEGPRERTGEPDALEIARRACARGEIDRERYLQVLEDLKGPGGERDTGS